MSSNMLYYTLCLSFFESSLAVFMVYFRAVRAARPVLGRPIRASGFVGPGLKSPNKKQAAKLRPEPGPIRALGPARFKKKTFLKQ
jgi:hypothetical protein